jgi:hypothetical protein
MLMNRPITVDASNLTTNAAAETQWNSGTTYALGDEARGPAGANEDKMFQSIQAGNTNHAVTDAAWWVEVGPSNPYRMFDQSPQSQTTRADSLEVTVALTSSERVNTLYLDNLEAATAQVVVDDPVDGVVYDETYSLVSDSGITDWYAYFFEPIVRLTALTIADLPPNAGAEVTVELVDAGDTVACGICQLGLSRTLGDTRWSPTVGITDYSRKETDDFGNFDVVERAFAKRGNFSFWVPSGQVDSLQVLLAQYRATPVLWIGDVGYTATAIYGFWRSFEIEIAFPDVSLCTIEIEGMT